MSREDSNAINAEQEALSTNAEQLVAKNLVRRWIIIQNLDSSIDVYLGHNDAVSSTTGVRLRAGESIRLDTSAAIWMEAASGTPTVAFIEGLWAAS